jgi:hypothetical protein
LTGVLGSFGIFFMLAAAPSMPHLVFIAIGARGRIQNTSADATRARLRYIGRDVSEGVAAHGAAPRAAVWCADGAKKQGQTAQSTRRRDGERFRGHGIRLGTEWSVPVFSRVEGLGRKSVEGHAEAAGGG